ncbi:hypothetical protein HDU76_009174, partial [Blyttiomyces sp. JEL0837]
MDLIKIQETLARLEFEKKAARAAKAALKEATAHVNKSKVTTSSTRGTTPRRSPRRTTNAPPRKKQRNKLKRRIKEAAELEAVRIAELASGVTGDMAEQVGVVENEKTGQVHGVLEVVEKSEVSAVVEMKVAEGHVGLDADSDGVSCVVVKKRENFGVSESFEAVDKSVEVVSTGSDMVPEVIDNNAVPPAVVDDINLAGDLVMEPAAQIEQEELGEQLAELEQNGATVAGYER